MQEKPYHSVASDYQRAAMIQIAMRRAGEVVREIFYNGLMMGDMGDTEVTIFAEDAWDRFVRVVTFDYPDYAHVIFLRAYRLGYQAFATDLPRGQHPNTHALAEQLEEEMRQAHDSE